MSELIHLFPLAVYATTLDFSDDERNAIADLIEKDAKTTDPLDKKASMSWTGDIHGHEFLHKRKEFGKLFTEVNKHLGLYIEKIGAEPNVFDFYFTRSWGTVTTNEEQIGFHTHRQSHLSAVYYPRVPENAGALVFNMADNPNEFIPGLIREKHFQSGIIKGAGYLVPNMNIWVQDDILLIFPSKMNHGTEPNRSGKTRVSIAADIICVLKDSTGQEFCLPPVKMWSKF